MLAPIDSDLSIRFYRYAKNDAVILMKALLVAQFKYMGRYQVDITTIFSTASLAMKVYLSKFMPENINTIPILSRSTDEFVRKGYLGGATDFYKPYGEYLKSYDINSLYPYAQCKEMPYECLGFRTGLDYKALEGTNTFFGFIKAHIEVPASTEKPMLPYRYGGKTIFPTGQWIGTYFSEELKAVQELGYKIRPIEGYEFSKKVLFENFIHHFYDIKKIVVKIHLND